jgi:hypothetical protein
VVALERIAIKVKNDSAMKYHLALRLAAFINKE